MKTDLKGLKIAIDLKRWYRSREANEQIFRFTPARMGIRAILMYSSPQHRVVMGVREILSEWIAFRFNCVRRRVFITT
jgi:DNA gyrase subunit A